MKTDSLREKFLSFFRSKGHKIVESDSLVPKDDPTVLFTPAGMNQFKKQFLGLVTDFRRAATSQRCLRTGDLDNVGKTAGHHTFFEMLGNFSFGDYFKADAIPWAWEFLTKELGIKKEILWVSVYKDDTEAYDIWKEKIGIQPERIVRLGDKSNFWPSEAKEKGPNGPCGPCTEIFFDQGKDKGCGKPGCDPGCDCGRFIEIWNLVFTQFNRKEGGELEPLPQKNIDTGMGLERLAALMQGAPNNFETDLFKPLVARIKDEIKEKGAMGDAPAIYAVADHIRAISFAISDGVLPSNEGRGYVIRKIIRKSSLHLRSLGIEKPYLYKLVAVVADIMKTPYPELEKRREDIAEIVLAEEKNFISILDSSESLFEEKFGEAIKDPSDEQIGRIAFQMYDTYGIPFELTEGWLGGKGVKISQAAFDKAMEEQKSRSKSQSSMKGDVFDAKQLHLGLKETEFLGYESYESQGKVLKLLNAGVETDSISEGDHAQVILDKSAFYAESGGQVGDTGELVCGSNVFTVTDTKKADKVIVHIGFVKRGSFKKSDIVSARVDIERRLSIARNHTATHLLQAALRKVLGEHVQQQGSLVAPDRLRFDFKHFKDLSDEELERIEGAVNADIMSNHGLTVTELPVSEAKKTGALAFFGEKYEDKVRVVSISGISKEFCGGTHLGTTGQIGLFMITQEGSVASGIRRIEAITGSAAYKSVKEQQKLLADICSDLGVTVEKAASEIEKKLARIKELEKQLNVLKIEMIKDSVDELLKEAQLIDSIKFIAKDYPDADMGILRSVADVVRSKSTGTFIVATSGSPGQVSMVLAATKDLVEKGIDASKIIKEIAPEIGGSGGGRKDFAQAGGNKPENRESAILKLKGILTRIKL